MLYSVGKLGSRCVSLGKCMVGGGATTADFAHSIGADGYDPIALGAVELARRLIGK
jgi:methanogenic corrinoid protein MtbC1